MRVVRPLLPLLALMALLSGPARASDATDAIATLHQFSDGLNKGDMKSALAACADETSIVDDVPPHEWHGAGACARWAADLDAASKKNGISDEFVSLGKPRHVDITGDRAYLVVPAMLRFKLNGKPMQHPAFWTLAMHKEPAGWRITGWAWSNQ